MGEILKNSIVYNLFASIAAWFSGQFEKSSIIGGFLTERASEESEKRSLLVKIFNAIINVFRLVFEKLRLTKLLDGSIFTMPIIWCFIAIVLAPVLPTMAVLGVVMVGFLSVALKLFCDRDFKLRYYPVNKFVFIYAVVYFITTFTSVDVRGSLLGGMLTTAFILSYFVVINAVKTKKQLKMLTLCFICVGVLVSFYGFYQYLNPSKFSGSWVDKEMFSDIGFRVYATLENPNVFGEYLLLLIPLVVAFFFNSKGILKKAFYVIVGSILMLSLILTYSRGCWLGIMFAAVVFLILLDRRFIILILIGILLMPFVLPETIINRFMSIGNMSDSSTSYRFYIYMGTLSMLKDYWMCGVGPGTAAFNMVYPSYAYDSITAPHSHNLYLQVMCDSGICGEIVFLAVIYRAFKTCSISLKNASKEKKIFVIGALSSLCGFLVQSLFDYTFYNYRVMFLFWAVLGLSMLYADIDKLKEE